MDIIGIIFLAIALMYFVKGVKKGFIINLLESIKTILLFVLAIVFCKIIGASLLSSNFGELFIDKFQDALVNLSDSFNTIVTYENKELLIDKVWEYVPLPSVLKDGCQNLVVMYFEQDMGLTIGYYIAKALAYYVMISIGFVLILLVGSLVLGLIIKLMKKLFTKPTMTSRVLGGIVGLVRALIIISVYCYIISVIYSIMPNSFIGKFIDNSLNNEVGIFRFFYENNLITYIFNLILKSL